jgi:lipid-binding SYLF domain-containing protein
MEMKRNKFRYYVVPVLLVAVLLFSTIVAGADKAAEIDRDVDSAIQKLYTSSPAAKELSKVAKGVLVFPNVVKGGLIIGGQYGKGALRVGGKTVSYYSLAEGSVGWQIGAQKYDMVILFMTDEVLKKFRNSENWEAGVDAEVTIIAVGAEVSVETLRSQNPVAGFVFDQKGVMGGVSVKGAKFTKIKPE